MKIYFLSIFPDVFHDYMHASILGRALNNQYYSFECINIRDFATDKHKSVDDHPYGGGPGMVMRADILESALLAAFAKEGIDASRRDRKKDLVIITSASGVIYTQQHAQDLSSVRTLFIVCGHYEGIDQRFIDKYADIEISIGEYVLTGGELAAMVIADSVVRLMPGVLGSGESVQEESYSFFDEDGLLLEYPHYTRPAIFHNVAVPEVLSSGNHKAIADWRLQKSRELRLKRAR